MDKIFSFLKKVGSFLKKSGKWLMLILTLIIVSLVAFSLAIYVFRRRHLSNVINKTREEQKKDKKLEEEYAKKVDNLSDIFDKLINFKL